MTVLLALGAMSGNAAAAKKVLVLKEEGKPVAVNAELQVELEYTPHCVLAWPAHMLLNDAKAVKINIEPVEQECHTESLYPEHFSGQGNEVQITNAGKVKIRGQWRERYEIRETGAQCTDQFEQLKSKVKIPGPTEMVASGRFTLVEESRPHGGSPCVKKGTTRYAASVRGHNGKPLEAEVLG